MADVSGKFAGPTLARELQQAAAAAGGAAAAAAGGAASSAAAAGTAAAGKACCDVSFRPETGRGFDPLAGNSDLITKPMKT